MQPSLMKHSETFCLPGDVGLLKCYNIGRLPPGLPTEPRFCQAYKAQDFSEDKDEAEA
jgi:hypothetical protein